MTWIRFNYICRRLGAVAQMNNTTQQDIQQIETEPGTELYGEAIPVNSLGRHLLNKLSKLTPGPQLNTAISVYGGLNLAPLIDEPKAFIRYVYYLYIVSSIYFVVSWIYQFYVTPAMNDMLVSLSADISTASSSYYQYWPYYQTAIAIALVLIAFYCFVLRRLFKFKQGQENSLLFRFFISKGVKESYRNVVGLLTYPVQQPIEQPVNLAEPYFSHLKNIEQSKMNLATELQALIKTEAQKFHKKTEQQIQRLLVCAWIIIIAAIYVFLSNAYAPIFVLGELF